MKNSELSVSGSTYATRRKELLALVNQLRAVGAQGDLDLPRIAVIGNQSAGKSSVVEAISGINVPRDAGTCTRCPMECRLSSSNGPWSCRVSIRREFDDKTGKRLQEIKEVPFGEKIIDKSKVELALRRAQLAVLSPTMSPQSILALSAERLAEISSESTDKVPFSRNVVCVDLEGPDLTDLSFVDLPGLIQNADPHIVDLVEGMVVSHIQGNCIILVAIPMTDDIENQKALRLARQEDPNGLRTIGVMTKPDMLSAGAVKSLAIWMDVIEGRKHPLTHGYYCTRQPDDAERHGGITTLKARQLEADFFRETVPWSKSSQPQRFGMDNLISTLSRLLVQIIHSTLPRIRADAQERLEACRHELSAIPEAIDEEPATYMLNLITTFSSQVQSYVKGGGADLSRLIHENRKTYGVLKVNIRRTAPNFVPFRSKNPTTGFINALEEDLEDANDATKWNFGKPFNLDDMKSHISRSITRELPGNVPFEAKVSLILAFQKTWPEIVDTCLDRVKGSTAGVLKTLISTIFSRYVTLQAHIDTFVAELIEKHYEACLPVLRATLEVEKEPFTQNTHYLQDATEKWLSKYKDARSGDTSSTVEPQSKWPRMDSSTEAAETTSFSAVASAQTAPPSFSFSGTPSPFSAFNLQQPTPFGVSSASSQKTTDPASASQASISDQTAKMVPPTEARPNTLFPGIQPKPSVPTASTFKAPVPSTSTLRLPFALTTPNPNPTTPKLPTDAEKLNTALAALAALGYSGISEDDLPRLLPPDHFETELSVMAEVRGYFQIAYKRLIDNIPSFIDLLFVKAIGKDLQPFLISKFGLGTAEASERCAMYLAEDPILVARRNDLLSRQKRLVSVQLELNSFGIERV